MAQITIYLPDAVEKKARKAAQAGGKSVSRWIAQRVVEQLQSEWPKEVLSAAGSLPDFPNLSQIRKGYGRDARREKLACPSSRPTP